MKTKHDFDSALAAEFALGTLRGAARQRFMRRIEQEPKLAAEVRRWQNALAELDREVIPVAPPETLWPRILGELPAEPQHNALSPTPVGQPVKIPRSTWPMWLGWGLAASFAGALLYTQLVPAPAPPQAIAVLSNSQQQGIWVIGINPAQNRLTVQTAVPPAIGTDHSLQLWLIPPGGKPQSLGLLDVSGNRRVDIAPLQAGALPVLAISLEPPGGSPTGQPTGPVLFSGKISLL
ncbi:anti-sigma factor domain-containing protein [Erwinia sp. JUb26]|uniref:anti-sigma factor n=1 Tax=Erwinia sp. JUb26 TaxID=2485126 RepID=UPI000F484ABD|nr:anti-sigma factor [Erwinia sp. JUb26]ROR05139.1 anti-sigma-K factor RskA [Erwinia sp. JUb26]